MDKSLAVIYSPKLRIAWHILFWSAAVVFFTLFFGHQQKEYTYTLYFVGILMPITMVTTYTLIYYLVPKYLINKRYFGFFIRTVFTILASFYLGTMAIFMMLFFFIYGDGPQMDPSTVDVYFLAVGMYFVIMAAVVIKLFKLWYEKHQKERKLEKEKLQAELNMLKSQIHPHFLFNTLNNIYSLSLQKSDAAPEMLVKLSEILHYILYECNGPFVPLEKEVTLLKNYLALEKIRYDRRLELDWTVPDELPSIDLAPMILLPFVENAFKHGASKMRDKASIKIELAIEEKKLEFRVINTKPVAKMISKEKEEHGLGLSNVRQRLEMIYPANHRLEIQEEEATYSVYLFINTDITLSS
jgi:sensor histidine kinase YesM